ncbi:MAG: phosphomannose isomerase-like protein [Alphaproteobacteria bacterium]|nr:phosphomannose isomerase-like protein [Alphaproteobacteria bacterium]
MNAIRLTRRRIEKVWGRRDLLPAFGDVPHDAQPVGEVWFEDPRGGDAALLVKYLFTSERLSIQVHPDEQAARARGGKGGKDEAWLVLDAEPGATIGIGLRDTLDKAGLRDAACDGALEHLIDWRPAQAGDHYYSPAGTIHALGPGLKLIEVQQNVDLTYRLFDYGRPRALHLDDAVAVADPAPYRPSARSYRLSPGREILAEGAKFVLERWTGHTAGRLRADRPDPLWLVPVSGDGSLGGAALDQGDVWLVEGETSLSMAEDASMLVAYAGGLRQELLKP